MPWPAAGERYVRATMYEAGLKFRGLEFQVEEMPVQSNEDGVIQRTRTAFHLVLATPCSTAGDDHWPCSLVTCEAHERPIDEWYEIPALAEKDAYLPALAGQVIRRIAECPVDLEKNAALWDALHAKVGSIQGF